MLRIEAKLPSGWWLMPYKFADEGQRATFVCRLRAENPGREFRSAV